MTKKSTFKLLALAAAMAALQGCGGGGGGGGFPLMAAAPPSSDSQAQVPPPSVPDTSNSTGDEAIVDETPGGTSDPRPTPSDPFAPIAGTEPAPTKPEPGSTAEVGAVSEGIYQAMFGYTFIDSNGKLSRRNLIDWIDGTITVTGDVNWTVEGKSYYLTTQSLTGSGTFTPKTSMQGSYSTNSGSAQDWGTLKYSLSNSLAITPASLQGKWSVTDGSMSVEFDQDGMMVSGTTSGATFGVCDLSITAAQSAPGTSKNLFSLTMTAVNAATGTAPACKLDTVSPYSGLAAVVLTPAGNYVGNGYFRTFAFNAVSNGNPVHMVTSYLRKEQ